MTTQLIFDIDTAIREAASTGTIIVARVPRDIHFRISDLVNQNKLKSGITIRVWSYERFLTSPGTGFQFTIDNIFSFLDYLGSQGRVPNANRIKYLGT